MREFDLSPLYRRSIGFDRFARVLDDMLKLESNQPGYPPYNIGRINENTYRVSLAVAGFDRSELGIEIENGVLTIRGQKLNQAETEESPTYLHRGIAMRDFERRFELADHVKVESASMENGLLHIELTHEVPEVLKPLTIRIEERSAILAE